MRFLVSGTNPKGQLETKIIEATDGDRAVKSLINDGFTDVRLRSSEKHMIEGLEQTDDFLSADEYLDLMKQSPLQSVVKLTWKLYRSRWISTLLYLVFLIGRSVASPDNLFLGGGVRGWNWMVVGDWYCAVMLLLPPALAVFFQWTCESNLYNKMIDHVAWHRWDEALEIIPLLKNVPPEEITIRKAQALAGLGRIEEAESLIRPLDDEGVMPRWQFLCRIADIYHAYGDDTTALELTEQALQAAPENPQCLIDLAFVYARQNIKLDKAQGLLHTAQQHELEDIAGAFVPLVQGWIDFRRDQRQESLDHLEQARLAIEPYRHSTAFIDEIFDEIDALCAINQARDQNHAISRSLFDKAKPRLLAQNRVELLNAYLNADPLPDPEGGVNPYQPPKSTLSS